MARMPGAQWDPISINYTAGGMGTVTRVIIHVMAGTYAGTDSWFRNPTARVSAHFGTSKAGALKQWVDVKDRAWHAADANSSSIGIENEGRAGDSLTGAQILSCAEVLAWAHETRGVPLRVSERPSESGLSYHGLGGAAWGNHTSCPGPRIVAQLPEIVKQAKKIIAEKEDTLNKAEVFDGVWDTDKIPAPKSASTASTNKTWKAKSFLPVIVDMLANLSNEISELRAEVEELKKGN